MSPGYRDAHPATQVKVVFTDTPPSDDGLWTTMCVFTGTQTPTPQSFPAAEYGFAAVDGQGTLGPPRFARKKSAKQYAAKCCVDWLIRGGHMPDDGSVAFPKPRLPPPPKKVKAHLVLADPRPPPTPLRILSSREPPATTAQLNSLPDDGGGGGGGGVSIKAGDAASDAAAPGDQDGAAVVDDGISACSRVSEICGRLGISPPRYVITESNSCRSPGDATLKFWNGRADFGVDNVQLPDGVGVVKDCYGKQATKEAVANALLQHLLAMEARREMIAKILLADMATEEGAN